MRIRTDGDKAHREDTLEATAELVGRNKTDSVLRACLHAQADHDAKRELAEYLADELRSGDLAPRQAREICDILDQKDILFAPAVDVDVHASLEGDDD